MTTSYRMNNQGNQMNDELKDLLKRVRYAKEILGMGGYDHAYQANKVLEVVANKLRYLCEITEDDKGEEK